MVLCNSLNSDWHELIQDTKFITLFCIYTYASKGVYIHVLLRSPHQSKKKKGEMKY